MTTSNGIDPKVLAARKAQSIRDKTKAAALKAIKASTSAAAQTAATNVDAAKEAARKAQSERDKAKAATKEAARKAKAAAKEASRIAKKSAKAAAAKDFAIKGPILDAIVQASNVIKSGAGMKQVDDIFQALKTSSVSMKTLKKAIRSHGLNLRTGVIHGSEVLLSEALKDKDNRGNLKNIKAYKFAKMCLVPRV